MLDPSKYLDWLKLSGRSAFILLVISSILLFGNDTLINKLGLLSAREYLKTWVGVVWLISISITLAELVNPIYKWVKNKIEFKQNLKKLQSRLHELTPNEKEFLSVYIKNNTRTNSANISDGVVSGLVSATIVYRSSQLSHYHTVFPYNIQPWAWDYLQQHPECLE